MKTYSTQAQDSFSSLAKKFNIKNENVLKTFHNLHCPEEHIIKDELPPGTKLLIPEDPELMSEYPLEETAEETSMNTDNSKGSESKFEENTPSKTNSSNSTTQFNEKKTDKNKTESTSSPHEGKYFVIQKGMCQCNQGFKFPKFKVKSHQKHYWNDEEGKEEYLAVTEDDLTFDPPAQPFGQCKLKPSSGGYLPCAYAPSGKWTKTYDKVKVMGKSCVTEISELLCSTGGKITILKHGQQSEIGKSHVMNANSQEQQIYNPIVNFDEFKEKIQDESEDERHAW